jgi:hypothetical protein
MTIRTYLNRRMVWTFGVMLGCAALFAGGGLLSAIHPWFTFVVFLGFGGFAVCILFLSLSIRCPKCRHRISGLAFLPAGGYFRLAKALGFCPFCGVRLDAEVDRDGKLVAPTNVAGTPGR